MFRHAVDRSPPRDALRPGPVVPGGNGRGGQPLDGAKRSPSPAMRRGRGMAAGIVQVEIRDPGGTPFPGFSPAECDLIYGDSLDRRMSWKGQKSVASLIGTPVILRFVMREADIYSLIFESGTAQEALNPPITPLSVPSAMPSSDASCRMEPKAPMAVASWSGCSRPSKPVACRIATSLSISPPPSQPILPSGKRLHFFPPRERLPRLLNRIAAITRIGDLNSWIFSYHDVTTVALVRSWVVCTSKNYEVAQQSCKTNPA